LWQGRFELVRALQLGRSPARADPALTGRDPHTLDGLLLLHLGLTLIDLGLER
jgi:hypothetical protein